MVVGVVGRYCAGKNRVAAMLESLGFLVVDEDHVGHLALEEKRDEILSTFGPEFTSASGEVDRRRLGAHVFSESKELARLESIVHPWMVRHTEQLVDARGERDAAINAALLFKMGLERLCDVVLVVRAPLPVRFFRALRRDRLGVVATLRRFAAQRSLNMRPGGVDMYRVSNMGAGSGLEDSILRILGTRGWTGR